MTTTHLRGLLAAPLTLALLAAACSSGDDTSAGIATYLGADDRTIGDAGATP